MKDWPSISIVIPSYNSKKTIVQCLNSVLNQSHKEIVQVVVVDSSDDGTDEIIREFFPNVKLIALRDKTLAGASRNIGVKATNSEYIAFTDSDCIVDHYWIENVLRRMKSGDYDAVGGAILNGTPESLSGTLGYLNEFSFYLPQRRSEYVDTLATANVCYRRCIFDSHQFMETLPAGQDTVFHWSLIDNGEKLFFDSAVKITHLNRTRFLTVLKHQRQLGGGAGTARILMKRDLLLVQYPILCMLALPWVRILRMYRRLFLLDKDLWRKVTLFFPVSLIIAYSWSFGFFRSLMKHRKINSGIRKS
jgi:glycosyltransferase involved in cell wall biosynthesis